MKRNTIKTFGELESIWVTNVITIAEQLKFDYVVWEEVFSNGVKINNQTIVEVWKGRQNGSWNKTMGAVTKAGYRAILAAPWYLNDAVF